MAVITYTKPTVLVRALEEAALPYVEGEEMREDASHFDVYKAMAPILAGYTLADVAPVADLVRNAINSEMDKPVERAEALHLALTVAEQFMAYARASGPEDVAVRASMLTKSLDDDGVFGTNEQRQAACSLQRDIADLVAGHFEGDTFDGFANGNPGRWLFEALFNLEGLSAPAVSDMANRGDAA